MLNLIIEKFPPTTLLNKILWSNKIQLDFPIHQNQQLMKSHDDPALLDLLTEDAKKVDGRFLPGDYWTSKTFHSLCEIKRCGLKDFRGTSNLISQSYGDNIHYDVSNELFVGQRNETLDEKVSELLEKQLAFTKRFFKQILLLYERVFSSDEKILNLIDRYHIEQSTGFGCVNKISLKGKPFSLHYLDLLQQLDFAFSKINIRNIKTFFEIGGGFGATAHLVLKNFQNIRKYLYLDIVPNLYVGTQYLKSIFKDSVSDYTETHKLSEIKFRENNDLEIICIAPWQLSKFRSRIDLFFNSHSFVEIPNEALDFYKIEIMKRLRSIKSNLILISYDGFNLETTHHPDSLPLLFPERIFAKYSFPSILDVSRHNSFYVS